MRRLKQLAQYSLIALCTSCSTPKENPPTTLGVTLDGFPISQERLDKLSTDIQRPLTIVNFFIQWPKKGESSLPLTPTFDAIHSIGATPCLTWEPMHPDGKNKIAIPYSTLSSGEYDTYILTYAKEIKKWGHTVIIRLAHEMNLQEYHWGMDSTEAYDETSPNTYVKLFRYVVDLFHNEGVQNVLWAFCPNVDSVPNTPWNRVANYYPGHQYVDILGMDGYNWAKEPQNSRSFKDIFAKLHLELKQIASHKPLVVFETASSVNQQPWLANALQTSQEWGVETLCWFQTDKELSWSLK